MAGRMSSLLSCSIDEPINVTRNMLCTWEARSPDPHKRAPSPLQLLQCSGMKILDTKGVGPDAKSVDRER